MCLTGHPRSKSYILLPSKHEISTKCWYNVGPPSAYSGVSNRWIIETVAVLCSLFKLLTIKVWLTSVCPLNVTQSQKWICCCMIMLQIPIDEKENFDRKPCPKVKITAAWEHINIPPNIGSITRPQDIWWSFWKMTDLRPEWWEKHRPRNSPRL